uniref:NAC domain-containing protein 69 n=2 Tax=Cajanus cajan TaxID=3821 RepID=A0A151RBG7_CAJCA|nr:NAC domain-containing protein 69 [Cajanus cajan]
MESRGYPDLVGLGFRPRDDELVGFYLKHKLLSDDPRVQVIPVIDLCQVDPWHVPVMLAESAIRFNDPEWFFFSPVDFKYSNSRRFNRTTKCGFWKTTGKERDIRSLDTNTVIGTKKTLVFYEGRVPRGVRSNWVIHEYHDATFHQSQRTFVLCRLMKKPEKKTKGGTDTQICDEGESSRSMVSDYENRQATAEGIPSGSTFTGVEIISQATPQTESPTGVQHEEPSFSTYPFYNAYFRNENNVMQTPFETTEKDEFLMHTPFETTEKDEFLMQTPFETTTEDKFLIQTPFETTEVNEFINSLLADENLVIDEESMHVFVNNSIQSESLRRVYCESSDTDAEVVSKLDDKIVDTSTMYNEYSNLDQYHASKRFKSSHDVVYGDTWLQSSNNEANQEKEKSIFQDNFWGVETSSFDSTANKPLEINCTEISSSPFTPRSWESQYHPRPNNFTSQKADEDLKRKRRFKTVQYPE